MCSVLYVHVEAGKWGAGGTLSNVDMVIIACALGAVPLFAYQPVTE